MCGSVFLFEKYRVFFGLDERFHKVQGVPKKRTPKSIACKKIRKNIYGLPHRFEVARLICFSGKIVLINNYKHNDNYNMINFYY